MKKFYDYSPLGECCELAKDGYECGGPALYRVYFYDEKSFLIGDMTVCEGHFHEVIKGLEEV